MVDRVEYQRHDDHVSAIVIERDGIALDEPTLRRGTEVVRACCSIAGEGSAPATAHPELWSGKAGPGPHPRSIGHRPRRDRAEPPRGIPQRSVEWFDHPVVEPGGHPVVVELHAPAILPSQTPTGT